MPPRSKGADGFRSEILFTLAFEVFRHISTTKGGETMSNQEESGVLITKEACDYLRISRPTYVKYLTTGRVKGTKAGKGWKVLKSELDRFLMGENGHASS
jgi:excisionase family DNA binding protein